MLRLNLILCAFTVSAFAQTLFYSKNQTLPSLKRKMLLTEHFRIIYPKVLEDKAQVVAASLEKAFRPLESSLKITDKAQEDRIDLILQNQSAQSNGYVALAPFRSEWEALPAMSNSLGTTNWYLTLAIHEQRHIHQFLKYKRGFSKAMYYLFGDQGTQVSIAISTPRWFFEGDAVVEETLLTRSGRGRVANFTKQFRALESAKKRMNYDKVYYGSYNESMPNVYPLGYLLNLELRLKLKDNIFDLFVNKIATRSWSLYATDFAVEKFTGQSLDEFYQHALNRFEKNANLKGQEYSSLLERNDFFTNRYSLNVLKNKFIYYETSFFETGGFFEISKSTEEKRLLFRTNSRLTGRFKVQQNKFAYTDIDVHPRYGLVNYSNVFVYDLEKEERLQLTKKGQYFLSELNPMANKVASVFFDKAMNQSIVVHGLDSQLIKKITLNKSELIKNLSWLSDKELVVSGIKDNSQSFIKTINLESKQSVSLLTLKQGVINDLASFENKVYFSSDMGGKDNIYTLDPFKSGVIRVTDAKVAARYPYFANKELYFSDYDYRGMFVTKTKLKTYKTEKAKYLIDELKSEMNPLVLPSSDNLPEYAYDKKSFKFHSWSYITTLLSRYNGVASITASDNLNEISLIAGFENNFQEGATKFFLNFNYQKYWPIFHLNGEVGKRSVIIVDEDEREKHGRIKWDENTVSAGFTLPYRILDGGKNYSFSLTNLINYKKIEEKVYAEDESNGDFKGSSHRFNFSFNTLKPYARFNPSYLVNLTAELHESRTKTGSDSHASLKYLGGVFAAPGGFKTSSIMLRLDHQEKTVDRFNFEDKAFFAREYDSFTFRRTQTASLNYSFSLAYPDFNLYDYLYLKRIRMNLFHDHTLANKRYTFNSTGLETIFDLSPFRFVVDLGVGIRVAYLDRSESVETAIYLESVAGTF